MTHPRAKDRHSGVRCARLLVGLGTDSWDPECILTAGHSGACVPERPDYDMDAEPLLRGLLERDDLRRGVKADVEVALADVERLRDRVLRLEALVRAAPDYLGARQALHNHWIDEAAKVVGELGGDLPVEGLR